MPEGDTVWQTARRLHTALAGLPLVAAELRVPQHATAALAGHVVLEVVSRGKHILTRLEPGLTLRTHLGMEGKWWLHRPGTRWPPAEEPVRAVLENERAVAVGWRLARVDLVPTASEAELVGHLGPDLLGSDWDPAEAVRRLAAQPARTIGEALLDQRNLAGIGNLYRAEVLFLRGVDPVTPVRDAGDLLAMVKLARRLLHLNREHPEQATTGDLRKGRQHYVYGRTGRPCLRCGTRVQQGELDGRTTWWCPACQPARDG
jgi:endonuclease VIII